MPSLVTADLVQQWPDQKGLKNKLGSYPAMSLSKAREVFTRDSRRHGPKWGRALS